MKKSVQTRRGEWVQGLITRCEGLKETRRVA